MTIITGGSLKEGLDQAPPGLSELLSTLKIVGGKVPGSHYEQGILLHEMMAMQQTLGPPHIFLTVSPVDHASALTVAMASGLVAGDKNQYLRPAFMKLVETVRMCAENPIAAAQYYDQVLIGVLAILVGDANSPGVLGTSNAHYFITECQGRGMLHSHG